MRIVVAYSPGPRQVREWSLELPAGAAVADAIAASGIAREFPETQSAAGMSVGIWGRRTLPSRLLAEGDRVEVYRGLRVDPKVARRERFNRQGAKAAGLFANKRAGAKAGY